MRDDFEIENILSIGTVNNYMSWLKVFFEFALDRDKYTTGSNPANIRRIKDTRSPDEKRANFTTDELTALFKSPEQMNDKFEKPFQFWVPLIALFHGMRRGEIAQLYLDDIKKSDDGVWVFRVMKDISAEDKSRKNASSRRLIPIHPFLLKDLKFLNYIDHLRSKGGRRLFPELPYGDDGYGTAVGDWFNGTYKVACGIKPPADGAMKDFHSFRGTFISLASQKNVPIEKRRAVTGHSGQGVDSQVYVSPPPAIQLLDEVISVIDFQKTIDLSHLKKSHWVIKKPQQKS